MMKEKVKLSENQLREVIKESVRQVLEAREKHLLMEMPYPRKAYKERIENTVPQILINWCLVHYCTITGREQLKKHWKGELRGFLETAARYSIKGNDAPETRLKVFNEVWNEGDYSQPDSMNLAIHNKFYEEGINTKSYEYATTIIDCIKGAQGIFSAILSRNTDTITDYVDTI